MRAGRIPVWVLCALVARGMSLAHPGLHDELTTLGSRIAQAPTDGQPYLERAQAKHLAGDLRGALADLDCAAALLPSDARIDAERGAVYLALRCDAEAETYLARALGRGAPTGATFADWARVQARAGRVSEALAGFDAAIALAPDADVYLERGRLLEGLGRLDEAAAGYRDGFERLSGSAVMRSARLRVEAERGRPLDAGWIVHKDQRAVAEGPFAPTVSVLRQPYLQLGTETSMTVVWRTDTATDSRVRYGTTQGALDHDVTSATLTADHIVSLAGLTPGTRYFYDVGSTAQQQAGGGPGHYFETSPPIGSAAPFRAWVVGDSGTAGVAQAQVRDAMLAATAAHPPELFLHMGDIAYNSGTDGELTANHFLPYNEVLAHTVLWTTLGNHEGSSTVSGAPGPSIGPYYDAFVLPAGAEAGGVPSGTEAYYSFDYANVHFVSLNSYQVTRAVNGAMALWLTADLAANTQPWVIAFWHHPPYTHGTHNSDFEIEHIEMRENLLPILEAAGVDLVLGGHSHGYERSRLIDGTYATPTPGLATLVAQGNVLDIGDGRPDGDGAYYKAPGTHPRDGTVYVVAGHGGAAVGGALDHPVMYFSEGIHGSVLLDIDGDALDVTNLRGSGVVSDTFTLRKSPPAACAADADCESLARGCTAGICVNGSCATGPAADGTSCDDGDPCTDVDACYGGVCAGNAFVPADVPGLRWDADKTVVRWDPIAGTGVVYDLARGGPADFPLAGAWVSCVGSGLAGTQTLDADVPITGDWFWYLARGRTACHPGTWGHAGEHGAPADERIVYGCP